MEIQGGSGALYHSLPEYHKKYLNSVIGLVYQDKKTKIQNLFNSLDVDSSGTLNRADFRCKEDHLVDAALSDIWQRIQWGFDFNNDSLVTPQEFLEGFVLEAYTAKCGSTEVQEEYGLQLGLWVQGFNADIEQSLLDFYVIIRNSATPRYKLYLQRYSVQRIVALISNEISFTFSEYKDRFIFDRAPSPKRTRNRYTDAYGDAVDEEGDASNIADGATRGGIFDLSGSKKHRK